MRTGVWTISSRCFENGTCVEVKFADDLVHVRHSQFPGDGTLLFPPDAWRVFITAVRKDALVPA